MKTLSMSTQRLPSIQSSTAVAKCTCKNQPTRGRVAQCDAIEEGCSTRPGDSGFSATHVVRGGVGRGLAAAGCQACVPPAPTVAGGDTLGLGLPAAGRSSEFAALKRRSTLSTAPACGLFSRAVCVSERQSNCVFVVPVNIVVGAAAAAAAAASGGWWRPAPRERSGDRKRNA